MLLAFLMGNESQEAGEESAREFKNLIFAHDVVANTPGIFHRIYNDFGGSRLTPEEEEELEFVVPEDESDVMAMMNELRKTGWS